jgi:outer membrane protein assembly factor BamB
MKIINWLLVLILFGAIIILTFQYITPVNYHLTGNKLEKKLSTIVGQLPLAKDVSNQQIFAFNTLWVSDFSNNRVLGINREGQVAWEQVMAAPPIPARSYNTHTEYVTVAPSGNLIISDGEGMMVQEIDRYSHNLIWQYGVKDIQGYEAGFLHQPDKAYKINDHEVVINDGNNRRVIVVDQRTNEIVWQYGETLKIGSQPGLLRGNTSVVPLDGGRQFIITDTLDKRFIIVDRTSKQIVWEYHKADAKWLQHVWPTSNDTFVFEDRQRDTVYEVNRQGKILWTLSHLMDGSPLRNPTDVVRLGNGNVLIAEAHRGRVIEVVPETGQVVRSYDNLGLVTTIAIDNLEPIN